jgi:hypothetical protein
MGAAEVEFPEVTEAIKEKSAPEAVASTETFAITECSGVTKPPLYDRPSTTKYLTVIVGEPAVAVTFSESAYGPESLFAPAIIMSTKYFFPSVKLPKGPEFFELLAEAARVPTKGIEPT